MRNKHCYDACMGNACRLTDWLTNWQSNWLPYWLIDYLAGQLTDKNHKLTNKNLRKSRLIMNFLLYRKPATDVVNSTYQFVNNGSPSTGVSNPELAPWQLSKEPLVRRYCPAAGGLKLELSDNGGGVCFSGEAHGRTKRGSEKSTKLEQSSQKSAKSEDCPLMADDRWTF